MQVATLPPPVLSGVPQAVGGASLQPEASRAPEAERPEGERPAAAQSDADATIRLSEEELALVRQLAAIDREVRAHEQAHAAVGGIYAGSPSYTYARGPDGRQYAVAGSVPIDVSPVEGDPEATIAKARVVRRAALAPAQPSSQDRAIAAKATAMELQAKAELSQARAETQETPSAAPAEATPGPPTGGTEERNVITEARELRQSYTPIDARA